MLGCCISFIGELRKAYIQLSRAIHEVFYECNSIEVLREKRTVKSCKQKPCWAVLSASCSEL